jgi:uncharacterized membrane-anchored protein
VAEQRPGPDEPAPGRGSARAPGWREVLIVAAIVVGAVFAVQVLTSLLPTSMQEVVFRTPLAILVLVVGTLGLLLRIARRRSS